MNAEDRKLMSDASQVWISQGFDVFIRSSDGTFEIESCDAAGAFKDDVDALNHVVRHALCGSAPHILALWLDGQDVVKAFIPFDLAQALSK
jgi:hypothetical protein